MRKGTRSLIDSWLVAHALPPGITTTLHNVQEEYSDEEEYRMTNCDLGNLGAESGPTQSPSSRTISSGSKGSSGSGTPVRKISAHEFERGGLTKPLVTTIDGTPTFLSPPVAAAEVSGQIRKKSRHDVMVRAHFFICQNKSPFPRNQT